MDEQQKQTILDIPKIIAVGIAAPVATILTSRFGVAGTLIGLALSAVILTALADLLKVYLARAPATVAKVPATVVKMPGVRARLSWRNVRSRLRAAFARFSSLPPASAKRRYVLIGSVIAAGISFLVGLIVVTVLELGVGKNLSCWVWNDCSAALDSGPDQPLPQEEDQQQNLPGYSDEEQQQSPSNEEDSQGEDVSGRSQDPGQNTRSPEFPVPWTT